MARFFSNHEMKKIDKKLSEENSISTQKFKQDLKKEINKENHRINVDSAKKRAVNQRMDYDGFHQMVLGADLKGVKGNDIISIKMDKPVMNSVLTNKKFSEKVDYGEKNYIYINQKEEEDNEKNILIKNLEELKLQEESEISIKNFIKQWKATNDKISILLLFKKINEEEFLIMLNTEILQSDLFISLINEIGNELLKKCNSEEIKTKEEITFYLNCLKSIIDNKLFNSLKKFVGKKHKLLYSEIDEKKDELFVNKENEDDEDKVKYIDDKSAFEYIYEKIK
jgi:hypothetical protein